MDALVAVLDLGTTSVKAGLVQADGRLVAVASSRPSEQRGPDGSVTLDPEALYDISLDCLRRALEQATPAPSRLAALSLTSQRASMVLLDGQRLPVGPAISWQDLRGQGAVARLGETLDRGEYYRRTGLPLHPVFTLGKLLALRDHEPERFRKARHYSLLSDYLLYRLGAETLVCDPSNASLTGLLDVEALDYSDLVLQAAGLDRACLSALVPSGTPVGRLGAEPARRTGLPEGLRLVSGGGDQQCAALGAGAAVPGIAEVNFGTAAVPLCVVDRPVRDPRMRLSCCAHAVPGCWELEGLQSSAGASLTWLGTLLGPADLPRALGQWLTETRPDAAGPIWLPYLSGSAAPHWEPRASGGLLGLRPDHGPARIARAVVEGVGLETREILGLFPELGLPVDELRLTGGGTEVAGFSQTYADLLGLTVRTLESAQASLLGAAMLAATGAGLYPSVPEAAARMTRLHATLHPRPETRPVYETLYRRFQAAGARNRRPSPERDP